MTNGINALRGCVGEQWVIQDGDDMAPYLLDYADRTSGDALAVVRPATTAQVAEVMRIAARHGLVVTAQGGNTGLTGASVPYDGKRAVLLSLDRMKAIRAIDPYTPSITAEAGCILATLQNNAKEQGFCLPLGLGAEGSCTLGGVVSTNAGEIRALRYGNCRENVMGLEVVLADGSIWNGLRALRKNNMGYDLKQLFIGAEGGLGIVTAAVLRLTPEWRQTEAAMVAVSDPVAAIAVLSRVRRNCGDVVVACELIEAFGLTLALSAVPNATSPLRGTYPWIVLIEVATSAELGSLRDHLEAALADAMEAGEVLDAVIAESLAQSRAFWRLREGVVEGQLQSGASIKHDVSVPIGAVPAFIAQASDAARAVVSGSRPLSFGHIGDGNIHFTVIQPEGADPAAFMAHAGEVSARTHDIALALGGSMSAEHGIGRHKRAEFERIVDPVELAMMRHIKQTFDPESRMNPGVLLR